MLAERSFLWINNWQLVSPIFENHLSEKLSKIQLKMFKQNIFLTTTTEAMGLLKIYGTRLYGKIQYWTS